MVSKQGEKLDGAACTMRAILPPAAPATPSQSMSAVLEELDEVYRKEPWMTRCYYNPTCTDPAPSSTHLGHPRELSAKAAAPTSPPVMCTSSRTSTSAIESGSCLLTTICISRSADDCSRSIDLRAGAESSLRLLFIIIDSEDCFSGTLLHFYASPNLQR